MGCGRREWGAGWGAQGRARLGAPTSTRGSVGTGSSPWPAGGSGQWEHTGGKTWMLTLLCGLERLGASWMRYKWGETSSRHCQLQGRQVGNWVAMGGSPCLGLSRKRAATQLSVRLLRSHLTSSLEVMFKGCLSDVEWNKLAEDALHYCAPNWISCPFRQFFGDDSGFPTPAV